MMGNTAHRCLLVIFFFLSDTMATKPEGGFTVIVPSEPVVTTVGHDIILLCHLSPEMSASSKEVRWFKESFTNLVYLLENGKVTEGKQYEGRVSLFPQELQRGNVSLLLKDVKVSDGGEYRCHVSDASWYEEPSMNLVVTSWGTTPEITTAESNSELLELCCSSEGWHPEPTMFWRNERGQNLSSQTEKPKQMAGGGTYKITSHLSMKASDGWRVECVLVEPTQGAQFLTVVQFKEESFVNSQQAVVVISLALAVFALLLIFGAVYAWRKRKEYLQKLNNTGPMEQNLKELGNVCKEQEKVLDAVKTIPDSVWKLIQEHEVKVTLDRNTAHKYLCVSEDGKIVKWQENLHVLDNKNRFTGPRSPCLMATAGFNTDKHYWEVNIGMKTHWYVGVANENVKKDGNLPFTPENGFWVLRLNQENLSAATNSQNPQPLPKELIPQTVGVFVNCTMKEVSFYNVKQKCHIYTFKNCNMNTLYPFFSLPLQCKLPMSISTTNTSSCALMGPVKRNQQQVTSDPIPLSKPTKHHKGKHSGTCREESLPLFAGPDSTLAGGQVDTVFNGGGQQPEHTEKKKPGKFKLPKLKFKSNGQHAEVINEDHAETPAVLSEDTDEALGGRRTDEALDTCDPNSKGVRKNKDGLMKFKSSQDEQYIDEQNNAEEQSEGLMEIADEILAKGQRNTECDNAVLTSDANNKKMGKKFKDQVLKLKKVRQQKTSRDSPAAADKRNAKDTDTLALGKIV